MSILRLPENSPKGTFYCAVGYILGRKPVSYFRISERTSQMDCFSVSLAFLRGMEKEKLDELESHPDKKFFIERLCPTDWWQNMYSEQFQFPSVEKVIGKLYSYSEAEGVCPHLLVTGNNLMTKAFSCFILAAYLTGNDKSKQAVFHWVNWFRAICNGVN